VDDEDVRSAVERLVNVLMRDEEKVQEIHGEDAEMNGVEEEDVDDMVEEIA